MLLVQRLRGFLVKVVKTREPRRLDRRRGDPPCHPLRRRQNPSARRRKRSCSPPRAPITCARTIVPALARGNWVVCDRYIDSTRAYQGALGNVDPRLIKALERPTVGDVVPDLTFILDIDPTRGLARARPGRGDEAADRFEERDAGVSYTAARRVSPALRRIIPSAV